MPEIEQIKTNALEAVASAADVGELEEVRIKYLGKKSELIGLLKGLGKLDDNERPAAGAQINSVCLLYTSPSPRDATLSRMAAWG